MRGGLTDNHADGFGIGFFEGKGVRLFHDDKPSIHSPVADLIRTYQIKSENVIAHIRKATQGQTSLANTHPFMRGMWGEYWLFAHNGHQRNSSHLLVTVVVLLVAPILSVLFVIFWNNYSNAFPKSLIIKHYLPLYAS